MSLSPELSSLLTGWGVYVAATASPGPAIVTIIETAVREGRKAGLALALGVLTGSMTWACLTTLGISALIRAEPRALMGVELIGGTYLLWLAFSLLKKALRRGNPGAGRVGRARSLSQHYAKGYGLHLTNPKAIMIWIMLTSLAVPAGANTGRTVLFVCGCMLLGLMIFSGFALLFSIPAVHRAYLRIRRPFEAAAALFFTYAGMAMLTTALGVHCCG